MSTVTVETDPLSCEVWKSPALISLSANCYARAIARKPYYGQVITLTVSVTFVEEPWVGCGPTDMDEAIDTLVRVWTTRSGVSVRRGLSLIHRTFADDLPASWAPGKRYFTLRAAFRATDAASIPPVESCLQLLGWDRMAKDVQDALNGRWLIRERVDARRDREDRLLLLPKLCREEIEAAARARIDYDTRLAVLDEELADARAEVATERKDELLTLAPRLTWDQIYDAVRGGD